MTWTRPALMAWVARIEAGREHLTHFEVLEVAPTATADELRAAFHRLAAAAHPDLHRTTLGAVEAERLIRSYSLVSLAYATLRDPIARERYRAELAARPRSSISAAAGRARQHGAERGTRGDAERAADGGADHDHERGTPGDAERAADGGADHDHERGTAGRARADQDAERGPADVAAARGQPARRRPAGVPVGSDHRPRVVGIRDRARGAAHPDRRSVVGVDHAARVVARAGVVDDATCDRRAADRGLRWRADGGDHAAAIAARPRIGLRGVARDLAAAAARAQTYRRKGEAAWRAGDLGAALFNLRLAVAAAPGDPELRAALAQIEAEMAGRG
ncbi:MAG: DnaJ domain-containing protein [Kofleriaceae bacterium]